MLKLKNIIIRKIIIINYEHLIKGNNSKDKKIKITCNVNSAMKKKILKN